MGGQLTLRCSQILETEYLREFASCNTDQEVDVPDQPLPNLIFFDVLINIFSGSCHKLIIESFHGS